MPSEVPKDDQAPASSWRDPARFEEREDEMIARLNEVIQRGIPDNATVREAMLEMRRASKEEPEAKALLRCLMALALVGGGNVMHEWAEGKRGGAWLAEHEPE